MLKVTDLKGTGWTALPIDDGADTGLDDNDAETCGGKDPFATDNQASVDFNQDGADNSVFFSQEIGSAANEMAARAIYAQVIKTLNECSGVPDKDGFVITATTVPFAKVGDDSQGYKLVEKEADGIAEQTFSAAIVRDGRLVHLYFFGPAVSTDAAAFEATVKTGVARAHSLR